LNDLKVEEARDEGYRAALLERKLSLVYLPMTVDLFCKENRIESRAIMELC
jgi:hypothetical protein